MKTLKTKHAYSLVEIAVTVSIVALLVAILLGVIDRVREQSRKAECLNHLHQLGVAIRAYQSENHMFYPPMQSSAREGDLNWMDRLQKHVGSKDIFRCPEAASGPPDPSVMGTYTSNDFFVPGLGSLADGGGGTSSGGTTLESSTGSSFFLQRTTAHPLGAEMPYQAYKSDSGTFDAVYMFFANPYGNSVMQESFRRARQIEKLKAWGCPSACGPTPINDSQFSVSLETPSATTCVPDLRYWAFADPKKVYSVGPFNNVKASEFIIRLKDLNKGSGIPMSKGGNWVNDADVVWSGIDTTGVYSTDPKAINPEMGYPGQGYNGVWLYNKLLGPEKIRVYVQVHDPTWFKAYDSNCNTTYSYIFDVYVSATPEKPPDAPPPSEPGAVQGEGTVSSESGSVTGYTPGSTNGAKGYGGNSLINARPPLQSGTTTSESGGPYRADQVAGDTIILIDYDSAVVSWLRDYVRPASGGWTITGQPGPPPVPSRHLGGKANVLNADGSAESLDANRIPLHRWTPQKD